MYQKNAILEYMREHGSISPLEALQEFGCLRLAARINDLKREGNRINRTMLHYTNAAGRRVAYAVYSLASVEEGQNNA